MNGSTLRLIQAYRQSQASPSPSGGTSGRPRSPTRPKGRPTSASAGRASLASTGPVGHAAPRDNFNLHGWPAAGPTAGTWPGLAPHDLRQPDRPPWKSFTRGDSPPPLPRRRRGASTSAERRRSGSPKGRRLELSPEFALARFRELMEACAAGDEGRPRAILRARDGGALLEYVDRETMRGPLHVAARYGHAAVCLMLLVHDADMHALERSGAEPLALACLYAERGSGHLSVVKMLHSHGAQLGHADNMRRNALHFACSSGDAEMARQILDWAPTLVNTEDANGRNGLFYGLGNAHEPQGMQICALLLVKQCNVHTPDHRKCTPLAFAIKRGAAEGKIRLLLEHGAGGDVAHELTLGAQGSTAKVLSEMSLSQEHDMMEAQPSSPQQHARTLDSRYIFWKDDPARGATSSSLQAGRRGPGMRPDDARGSDGYTLPPSPPLAARRRPSEGAGRTKSKLDMLRSKLQSAAYKFGPVGGVNIQKLFTRHDRDHSRGLDENEFRRLCRQKLRVPDRVMSDAELLECFRRLDVDSSGGISMEELLLWFDTGEVARMAVPATGMPVHQTQPHVNPLVAAQKKIAAQEKYIKDLEARVQKEARKRNIADLAGVGAGAIDPAVSANAVAGGDGGQRAPAASVGSSSGPAASVGVGGAAAHVEASNESAAGGGEAPAAS